MGSTNAMLTQMIQDAVLKLCTQNVVFNKALEIDGIICVSPGDESKEIVVKMHRTIVKPTEQQVNPSSEGWPTQIGNSDYYQPNIPTTPRQLTDSGGFQRRPSPRITQSLPPKRPTVNRDNTKQPPSSPYYSPLKPPAIPSATQETPGSYKSDSSTAVGDVTIKDEPPSSPKGIKRSLSDVNTPTDTPEPEHSANKHSKISTDTTDTTDAVEPGPSDLDMDNVNVKQENEEPITIELDDDDDEEEGGGYEEGDESSMAGASWMGGDDTIDSNADPNDPNTDMPMEKLREKHSKPEDTRTNDLNPHNTESHDDTKPNELRSEESRSSIASAASPKSGRADTCNPSTSNPSIGQNKDTSPSPKLVGKKKRIKTTKKIKMNKESKSQKQNSKFRLYCDQCDASFTIRGNLTRHQKLHLGEEAKRYTCGLCDKKYHRKEHLRLHITGTHGIALQ